MSKPKLTDHQRLCQVQNIQVLLSEVDRTLEDITVSGVLSLASLRDMQRRTLLAYNKLSELYSDLNEGRLP